MGRPRNSTTTLKAPASSTFGEDVREVRRAKKITGMGLARATGYSPSYVSKVESGTVIPTPRFAGGCDKAFGTGDLFVRALRRVTEGEHPAWFAPYIDAEREASAVRDYSIAFIMGMMQTEAYARAVLEQGPNLHSRKEREAQIRSRMRRREVWDATTPPRMWLVLHEACLRAEIGSPRVMAEQVAFVLAELKRRRTLTVQVLPYTAAAAATSTPFTILETQEGSPVVYVEGPQGGRPYDTRQAVNKAYEIFESSQACSLSPHDSVAYLNSIRDDHERRARVDQVELQRRPGGPVRRVGPGSRARGKRPRPGQ